MESLRTPACRARQARHERAKRRALQLIRELDAIAAQLIEESDEIGEGFLGKSGSIGMTLGGLLRAAKDIVNEAAATNGENRKEEA